LQRVFVWRYNRSPASAIRPSGSCSLFASLLPC
jgi:hypothetical protein